MTLLAPGQLFSLRPPAERAYRWPTSVRLWPSPGDQKDCDELGVVTKDELSVFMIIATVHVDNQDWYLVMAPGALGWTPKTKLFHLIKMGEKVPLCEVG